MENCSVFYLQLLGSAFLAILFLQSGLDKFFHWKAEFDFQQKHFANTIFKNMIYINLVTITFLEIITGILGAVSIISLVFFNNSQYLFYAAALSTGTLLMLFLGQRIAKDYAGAASLVAYIILSFFILFISGMANVCSI